MQFVKEFKESSWLAYGSLLCAIVQAFILAPIAIVNGQDNYATMESMDGTALDLGPAQPFLNPDYQGASDWWTIVSALIPYAFTGVFLIPETLCVTEKPEQYKKALGYSCFSMYLLYMVPSVLAVVMWGWNVDFLLFNDFSGAIAIIINVLVFIPSTLDYILPSLILNDVFKREIIYRNTEEHKATSNPSVLKQMMITSPLIVFSFLFAMFVPSFEAMVTLTTFSTLIPGILWIWSLFYILNIFGCKLSGNTEGIKQTSLYTVLHIFSLVLGLFYSGVFLVSTIEKFAKADWSMQGIFCDTK